MSAERTRWKVLTHDLRSPLQGGDPVFGGECPYTLPEVEVDTGSAECAAGWNACREPHRALEIAGLWPTGRPSTLWLVESDEWHDRGEKSRCARMTILRQATSAEYEAAIRRHAGEFGDHADDMATAILRWWDALSRPDPRPDLIASDLRAALGARNLDWGLREYEAAWAVWAARDMWDASNAWAARAAWDAPNAWDARHAWTARDAWDAWTVRDAWAAWDAWDALNVRYAVLSGWVDYAPDHLEVGLLDAYRHGLEIALPTGPTELGYVTAATADRGDDD